VSKTDPSLAKFVKYPPSFQSGGKPNPEWDNVTMERLAKLSDDGFNLGDRWLLCLNHFTDNFDSRGSIHCARSTLIVNCRQQKATDQTTAAAVTRRIAVCLGTTRFRPKLSLRPLFGVSYYG